MNRNTFETVTTRHNHLIDPGLHIWGWEIPLYLFLGGLVAGILILVAALELRSKEKPVSRAVRWMPFAAVVLLSVGMLALFLDLEFKKHAHRFYLAFLPSSPMSWGSWILICVYPAAVLLGLGSLGDGERGALLRLFPRLRVVLNAADQWRTRVLWINVLVGAALGIYTGLLLGTMAARPLWNSALLGPLFLASGLSTGAAFLLLFRPRREEHEALVRWDMMAIGAEIVFIGLLLLDLATGPQTSQAAARMLLGGSWTGPFWALVVVAGLLVPLALEIFEVRRGLTPTLASAGLVLVGGISLRFILLLAGQESSLGTM